MKVETLVFSPFQENTYIVHDETGSCVVIDPGMLDSSEKSYFDEIIKRFNLKIEMVINTHCHLDHIFGAKYVVDTYNVPFLCHADDIFLIAQAKSHGQMYGLPFNDEPVAVSKTFNHGEIITFGNSSFEVLHIPGHSPGGVAFYSKKDSLAIVGDILFRRSIGRSDLPGGNHEQLIDGIQAHLLTLPDDTKIYSGHGASTTIGEERVSNPFLV